MFEMFDGVVNINITKSTNRVAASKGNDLGALILIIDR